MKRFLMFALSAIALSGCATIIGGGTTQMVTVSSDTPAASYEVRNAEGTAVSNGAVPGSVTLQRKGSYVVEVNADGYQSEIIPLNRGINGWFWANIIIGGVPGWIIDAVSGGMYKQVPGAVNVELRQGDDGMYVLVGDQRRLLTPEDW